MYAILDGLRVVEGSAFVAAPLGGMTLAQLGADVIRFDLPGGGLDARRWPLTAAGESLYWAGLNKGKRSLAVDFRRPEGQELVAALVTRPGPEGGLFLTNLPATGGLNYEALKARRADLILVQVMGNRDGTSAVDYTVNCAVGFPAATGPDEAPVNHVLPAWDMATGMMAALGLLAAERRRRLTGEGGLVRLALADVALAMVGHLGHVAEAQINGAERPALSNHLYGAFGRDFATGDGRRVMVVAITSRQWRNLVAATGIAEEVARLEAAQGVDLDDEGARFHARAAVAALIAPWCRSRSLADVGQAFDAAGACWGPYRSFTQMVAEDRRCSTANPLFEEVEQPCIGRYLMPGSPLDFAALSRQPVRPAPRLGEHTNEILEELLGLGGGEIGRLHERGVVAGPTGD